MVGLLTVFGPGCSPSTAKERRPKTPPLPAKTRRTRPSYGGLSRYGRPSMTEDALQFLKFFLESGIARQFAFDLADRVQHRRVVAVAETAADLGK